MTMFQKEIPGATLLYSRREEEAFKERGGVIPW
jgi:hypothetical protein